MMIKTCVKLFLIFQISGIALIVTAALIQTVYATYLDFLGSQFLSAPVLFIIVGVVIFLVAFFGCCGAVKESNCMMLTVSSWFKTKFTRCNLLIIDSYGLVLNFTDRHLHLRSCWRNCCVRPHGRCQRNCWNFHDESHGTLRPGWLQGYLGLRTAWGNLIDCQLIDISFDFNWHFDDDRAVAVVWQATKIGSRYSTVQQLFQTVVVCRTRSAVVLTFLTCRQLTRKAAWMNLSTRSNITLEYLPVSVSVSLSFR